MNITFVTDNYIIDPLGIAYLSSYLKKAGHKVDIIKTDLGELPSADTDILCYSVTTGKHRKFQRLNMEIKGNRFSLFGGPHCTFSPQFACEPGVDAIVMGEGYDAIVDIANALKNGDRVLDSMPNVATCVSQSELRPLKDKDSLLLPDRGLIYKYEENYNNPIKNVMCSFGCLFSCPYCYSKKYRQLYDLTGVELRSVESVIDEIDQLCKYPLKLIYFQDDIFPIWNNKWLDEFCNNVPHIPFHIQIRIEMLTEDRLLQLKEAGLHSLTFAIECGNETYRWNMLKRNVSNETILEKAELLHKYNIKFRTENMLGLPYESWDSMMETVKLNQQVNPTYAWASIFHAYPGTDFGNEIMVAEDFFHKANTPIVDNLQKIFALAVKFNLSDKDVKLLMDCDSLQIIHDIVKNYGYRELYGCSYH